MILLSSFHLHTIPTIPDEGRLSSVGIYKSVNFVDVDVSKTCIDNVRFNNIMPASKTSQFLLGKDIASLMIDCAFAFVKSFSCSVETGKTDPSTAVEWTTTIVLEIFSYTRPEVNEYIFRKIVYPRSRLKSPEVQCGLELPIVASGCLINEQFDKRTAEKHPS